MKNRSYPVAEELALTWEDRCVFAVIGGVFGVLLGFFLMLAVVYLQYDPTLNWRIVGVVTLYCAGMGFFCGEHIVRFLLFVFGFLLAFFAIEIRPVHAFYVLSKTNPNRTWIKPMLVSAVAACLLGFIVYWIV